MNEICPDAGRVSVPRALKWCAVFALTLFLASTASAQTLVERVGYANPLRGVAVGQNATPRLYDLDNDGRLDAVVGAFTGGLHYFRNTGSAAVPVFSEYFGSANPLSGVLVNARSVPAFVDIDGNARIDLFVGTGDGSVAYYQNTGTPSSPVFIARTGALNPLNGVNVGGNAAPVFVDIDGDSDFDCFIGTSAGKLRYFENRGTVNAPDFIERTGGLNPLGGVRALADAAPAFWDWDADGDYDLFTGKAAGTVLYHENTGSIHAPAFTLRTGNLNPFDPFNVGSNAVPALADLDGDGDGDAVVGTSVGNARYFEQTVLKVNAPPAIAGASVLSVTMDEDATPVPFALSLSASDTDGDPLGWQISIDPPHGIADVLGSDTLADVHYAPVPDYNGTDSFAVEVYDGFGGRDIVVIQVNITPVNDPPRLDAVGNKTVQAGATLSFTLNATDIDSATLSFSAQNLPVGAGIDPITGLFQWTPGPDQAGLHTNIVLQVSDDESTPEIDKETISIEVTPAPVEGEGEGEGEIIVEGEGEIIIEGEGEIIAEGEGEIIIEGEGEVIPEGEGEIIPEGEGEITAEGEGEIIIEGEGEIIPEGEGEIIVEGEGEGEGESLRILTGPEIPALDAGQARIEWTTSLPSTSQVTFHALGQPDATVQDNHPVMGHYVLLEGLTPETTYRYTVTSVDASGLDTVTSSEAEFQTPAFPDSVPPVILEGPAVTESAQHSLLVVWRTDEASDSEVEYGTTEALGDTLLDQTLTRDHAITVAGLEAGTPYFLRVRSSDAAANPSAWSATISASTQTLPDLTPPAFLSPPAVQAVTDTTAVIVWTTNEPSTTEAAYGTSNAFGQSQAAPAPVESHQLVLTGLTPNTGYYLRCTSADISGNSASYVPDLQFQTAETADTTPPDFTVLPAIDGAGDTNAIISWTSGELTMATVYLRDEKGNLLNHYPGLGPATGNSLELTGLDPATLYYVEIELTDLSGNTLRSQAVRLITAGGSFELSLMGPWCTGIGKDYAVIEWGTDNPASGQIRYGLDEDNLAGFAELTQRELTQSIRLTGLAAYTTYYYEVSVEDALGNTATSPVLGFITLPSLDMLDFEGEIDWGFEGEFFHFGDDEGETPCPQTKGLLCGVTDDPSPATDWKLQIAWQTVLLIALRRIK